MFYACFTLIRHWEGGKNFRVGIFLKLVRVGLQETKNFFLGLSLLMHRGLYKLNLYAWRSHAIEIRKIYK